jgi:predicted RNA-binding Zn ribbon-like protein
VDVEHALPARWLRCETGATWLDLVATVSQAYGPAAIEHLSSASRLREWLATQNLRPKVDPVEADLIRARELREALRGLALATVHGEPLPRDNAAFLGKVLADDQPLKLSIGPRLEIRPPATPRAALARIARQAAEHLAGPAAMTLHTCADPVCGMLFLDAGGRRRWCSADVCGVRSRVRAHRQRRSAADAP